MKDLSFAPPLDARLIYVFRINDDTHKGCLKIGMATIHDAKSADLRPDSPALNRAALQRIKQYTQTAAVRIELLYTAPAVRSDGSTFEDHDVHRVIRRSGIKNAKINANGKANEWFKISLTDAKAAIDAAAHKRPSIVRSKETQQDPICFRDEQQAAIDATVKHFKSKAKGAKHYLWDAKMRFGKTLCALQTVRKLDVRHVLILTHRPVVNEQWFDEFAKIFYDVKDNWRYGSKTKGEDIESLLKWAEKRDKHAIYFASLQDLRGSKAAGGAHDKNDSIFDTRWDLIIVDEAHEGTQTDLGKSVITKLWNPERANWILQLSGTPFNILENEDFASDEIYTWDYIAEQKAKRDWDENHPGDPNPYADLPTMNIYTYNLGALLLDFADGEANFNFAEFFRVKSDGTFLHENDVVRFLDLLCREGDSLYPFSSQRFRTYFRHTLWMLPGVKEARALAALLRNHPVLQAFRVVNVAGQGDTDDEEDDAENALQKVKNAIGSEPLATWTITLSCGRLTTGVSVPEWTAVFYLTGSSVTSISSYMQTIFRVQTPWKIGGMAKENAYVFDFAPDRTLKILAETAQRAAKASPDIVDGDRTALEEFIMFCPVISQEGSTMVEYDVDRMLETLKRVRIERAVNAGFDDANIYNADVLRALSGEDISSLSVLQGVIGSTRALPRTKEITINEQGVDGEGKTVGDEGEDQKGGKDPDAAARRERARQREAAISILRGISIRMPLLVYGADIDDEEEQITIDNFATLIDDASWREFMPPGITKADFARYTRFYDPVVFASACKRIRALARSADNLRVPERIKRIAEIFSTFRNPDKETVLTPWRVVNLHLGSTLGGFTFYNDDYSASIEDPRLVLHARTNKVFATTSHILEINSKSGLYALYAAYTIYCRRRQEQIVTWGEDLTVAQEQELWDETARENIFVLCKTPMAESITRRTLMGFRCPEEANVRYFPGIVTHLQRDAEEFAQKLLKPKTWHYNNSSSMKFDAVIGNPPYQLKRDDTSDTPVYHLFMDLAFRLSDLATLITPARFLFNAGKTPKEFNERVLNDEHFKVVLYNPDSTAIFSNVDIKGGVTITLRDKKQKFGKIIYFSAYPELKSILNKVISRKDFTSIDTLIRLQNKFNLDVLYADHPEFKSIIGSGGRERRLTTSIFNALNIFKNKRENPDQLAIIGLIDNKRTWRYVDRKYIEPHDNLDKYKVILPKSNGSGAIGEVLSTPIIGEPIIGYTQSFISIGCFDTFYEGEAALKYIKSRFARTMLGILKVTQDNNSEVWKYVPLQDFTEGSDIDWSVSVDEVDEQMFRKYGLSAEEQRFIREKVKRME